MLKNTFTNTEALLSYEELQKIIENSYAPYTAKLPKNEIPIKFMRDLPATSRAALLHDEITGDVGGIVVKPELRNDYAVKLALEHESVHYDQIINAPDYKMDLLFDPYDAYIMERFKEIEAHFRHHYKFAMDFKNEIASVDDAFLHGALPMLPGFLACYFRKQVDQDCRNDLQKLKESPVVEAIDVLPVFTYYVSSWPQALNAMSDQALYQQLDRMDRIYSLSQNNMRSVKTDMGLDPQAKLFQREFSFDDVKCLFNRDGIDYFGNTSSEICDVIWENVCTLDKDHEFYIQRMQAQAKNCF